MYHSYNRDNYYPKNGGFSEKNVEYDLKYPSLEGGVV